MLAPFHGQEPCECEDNICPLNGECGKSGLVYQATVTTQNNQVFKYVGLTSNKFKVRYKTRLSNFRNFKTRHQTRLSTKIWELKRDNINFEMEWRILKESFPYRAGDSKCRLCLEEIYYITFKPAECTLNKRSESYSKCRHENRFKLSEN